MPYLNITELPMRVKLCIFDNHCVAELYLSNRNTYLANRNSDSEKIVSKNIDSDKTSNRFLIAKKNFSLFSAILAARFYINYV